MRKIIAIGKCGLDVIMNEGVPVASFPGGRILNAAASLGSLGYEVSMVGECARDAVGDIVVGFLEDCNVNTRSIDRYTEGVTPATLRFSPSGDTVAYSRYPTDGFDVVWPRIDADDIVIFGSFFALDERVRSRLLEIINYAVERKAIIIYVPGFTAIEVPRITKVMPAILENFEFADIVISRTDDLRAIYNTDNPSDAFGRHINFYCRTMLNIDLPGGVMTLFNGSEAESLDIATTVNPLGWNAGAIAGAVEAIFERQLLRSSFDCLDLSSRRTLLSNSRSRAEEAAASHRNIVSPK